MASFTRKSQYGAVIRDITAGAQAVVDETAAKVQETAQDLVTRRDTQVDGPSIPGQPPATDTSNLVNRINLANQTEPLAREVASEAEYSAHLEYGTRNMAARPFMKPAADEGRVFMRANSRRIINSKRRRGSV